MKEKRKNTTRIAHQILAYLLKNPGAKDTMEGIANWWLLQQDIQRNMELVKSTVEDLMAKGFLLARHGSDLKTYYHVNPERMPVISALIVKAEQ